MNRRPLIVASAMAAALALTLSACGGGGDGGSDGTTKITFLSWTGEEQMTQILDAFEKAHPEVDIEASYSPPVAEYIQTLQTQVLSGTAPDVFIIAAENKTNLIEGGHVVDLADEPFMEKVEDFNLDTYGRDGGRYGLSLASWAAGYMYNVDLLAEVGYDTIPETWDEFLELCEALKAAGITPFLEGVDQLPTTVAAFVGAANSDMDPSLDELIFSGESTFEEQWTESLEQYNRLYTEGIVSTDVLGLDGDMIRDEFANGRVAIMSAGPWTIAPVREAAPDLNFLMAPIPGIEGGKPFVAGAASPGYAINSKSGEAEQAAAKVFLTWLATPEAVELINTLTGDVTVTSDFEPVTDEVFAPMAESIRTGQLYLPMISWQRSEDVLNVEAVAQIQRMIQGDIQPADVAKALDAKLAAS